MVIRTPMFLIGPGPDAGWPYSSVLRPQSPERSGTAVSAAATAGPTRLTHNAQPSSFVMVTGNLLFGSALEPLGDHRQLVNGLCILLGTFLPGCVERTSANDEKHLFIGPGKRNAGNRPWRGNQTQKLALGA